MLSFQPEYRLAKQNTENNTQQILLLQEEIEFLREQIEGFRQQIYYEKQQRKETEEHISWLNEMLSSLNEELYKVNCELNNTFRPKYLTLTQAKELAKSILASEKSKSESLAELLSWVYFSSIEAEELNSGQMQVDKPNPADIRVKLKNQRLKLKGKFNELSTTFLSLQSQVTALQIQCNNLKEQTEKLNRSRKTQELNTSNLGFPNSK